MATLEDIIHFMDEMIQDPSISNSIKEALGRVKEVLQDPNTDLEIKVNKALDMLEEISQDVSIPPFIRTSIWNISSMLESLN